MDRFSFLFSGAALLLGSTLAEAQASFGARVLETSIESMSGDGISLYDGLLQYREEAGDWRKSLTLSAGQIEVDYVPYEFDFFGFEETLKEQRVSAEASLRRVLSTEWQWTGTVGGFEGFTGYRSLWISNWYAQFFDGLEGLVEPSPKGLYGVLGGRWAFRPGISFLEADVSFARETIAPGYDEVLDEFGGLDAVEPLRRDLTTVAGSLAWENVHAAWLRSRIEYRLADQSERELRHGARLLLNASIGSRVFLRTQVGGTFEQGGADAEEDFRAWWVAGELIVELTPSLFLDVGGRLYHDNGEIENSIGFSSAAPDVDVVSLQAGLRYQQGEHAVRLAVGTREADYAEVGFRNAFFTGLYQDRNYTTLSLSYQYSF